MAVSFGIGLDVLSQNVAANSSTVRFKVNVTTTQGSYNNYGATLSYDIYYDGVFQSRAQTTIKIPQNVTNYTVFTKDVTVTHNSDGNKTVGMAISCDTGTSSGWQSTNKDFKLPTIGRASTFTVSGTKQLGNTLTINISRSSSSFTHNLSYEWGTRSSGIANGIGTSTTWTPPVSIADAVPNATSSICTVTCKTYSGGTLIGSTTQSFSLSIPSSVKPTIDSVILSDSAGFYEDTGNFISGQSSLGVKVSASGIEGSTISSYEIQFDGITKNSSSASFPTISFIGKALLGVKVTDSRGRTASKEIATMWTRNDAPDISSSYAIRTTSSSSTTESPSGTYIRIFAKGALKSGSGGTIVFEGKASTASSYTTLSTQTFTGTAIDKSYTWSGRSTEQSWEIRITCTDSNGTPASKLIIVNSDSPVMDFKYNGKGVAIGKVSEADAFEVGMPADFNNTLNVDGIAKFNNPVTLANTLAVNSTSTFGGTANFNNTASFTKAATFGNTATFNSTVNFNGTVNGLDLGGMKVSVLTAYNSGQLSVPNSSSEAVMKLNNYVLNNSMADAPSINTKSGYVYPPDGCKFVIVSGMICATSVTGGCNMAASLNRNSTTVAQGFNTSGGSGNSRATTVTFPPVYISASSNNYFYISARISGSTGIVMVKNCQLTMVAYF